MVKAIIVERDPVVRLDIEETLAEAFPGLRIVSSADLDAVDATDADFIITDQAPDLEIVVSWLKAGAQVFYSGTHNLSLPPDLQDRVTILQRPFSQTMLVRTVAKTLNVNVRPAQ